ncbi:MAG: macrocin O-methyltransferase [Rhodospirillaceae bacterium]|nr:macrocin O-methyltransferase [Rhodospirillaceae bacterium]MBT3628012.1 macrocin O-methyltransferase [Rhodospirillaceae bacterium]MBT3926101.1 macrocin O-methyltransferase [Rhodospirillaceae bacterium]MBT4428423.1 macrocin O-methyltransferase [Rhodospirillaceae bacterium]MBT5038262.1 macrocin O-methyltransferase [Rhodospirillaceae bacterium]
MTEVRRADISGANGQKPSRGLLHQSLRKLAFRMGYNFSLRKIPQYDRERRALRVPHDMEPEFVALYQQARSFTLTSVECMYTLYQTVRYLQANNVPGDMVECGVWRGGSSMMIALTLKALGDTSRDIYLYDTYAGMTRPESVDVRSQDGMEQVSRWQAFERDGYNEWAHAALDEVRANMRATGYPEDKLHFVEGEVETTIPAAAPEQISLLRLDTDWYRSTLHELNHLYPKLVRRGALIIDDYGAYEGSRKATDEYFADRSNPIFLGRIDEAARIGFKNE